MKYLAPLVLVLTSFVVVACGSGSSSENRTEFAACLTDAGWIMYGTEWCGYCKQQKQSFGSSFSAITYVDCDAQKSTCATAGIESYPTRVGASGQVLKGAQSLESLSEVSGCVLSSEISQQ